MDTVEVVVATIGRAHGVRGELTLTVRTDEPDRRLHKGARLRDADSARIFVLKSSRWVSGRFIATFEGITDRNQAETVRGIVLVAEVPIDETPQDTEEFYDRQLIGLQAQLPDGRNIGVVRDVLHLPAQDVLALDTTDGERLVPFVKELVPQVDVEAGIVRLADVPGLIDDQAIDDGTGGADQQ